LDQFPTAPSKPSAKLVKSFPAFYGTRGFFAISPTASPWALSYARGIQFTPLSDFNLRCVVNLFNTLSCIGRFVYTCRNLSFIHSLQASK